ncbi:MAG: putative glycoside hydrolase [Xanthomonadales bacterium]|nr:putative glycoside hydrolase [Xanthomonadales bacterium]
MTNLSKFKSVGKTTSRSFCLLLISLLSGVAFAQADEVVFSASGGAPWRIYLGSSNNWMVPVSGPVTTSYKSKVVTVNRIDNEGKADAIQAVWKNGLGQVYWQEDNPRDYRELSEQGGSLSMVIRVDKKPKKSVDIKMDCGYPCAGSLDMTKLLKSVPEKQWFRISLKLSCFEQAGANLGNIIAPLVVATTGAFKLSISDVRLLRNAPQESMIACG